MESYIQKHGITAKATAESFIKPDRIIRPTEEEFGKKLREDIDEQKNTQKMVKG